MVAQTSVPVKRIVKLERAQSPSLWISNTTENGATNMQGQKLGAIHLIGDRTDHAVSGPVEKGECAKRESDSAIFARVPGRVRHTRENRDDGIRTLHKYVGWL